MTNIHPEKMTLNYISTLSMIIKQSEGPGKRGHIVADTIISPFALAHNICCGHKFCVRDRKNCFWFCAETFCVRNECIPVCAAQETSWATMYQTPSFSLCWTDSFTSECCSENQGKAPCVISCMCSYKTITTALAFFLWHRCTKQLGNSAIFYIVI